MAGRAGGLEVLGARCRVTYQDGERLVPGNVVAAHAEAVDVIRDIADLRQRQIDRRHFAPSFLHNGGDQLAALIVENQIRPKEIGSTLAAARIGTMAEIASHAVERLSAVERGGIGRRPVRICGRPRSAWGRTGATAASTTCRRLCGYHCHQQRGQSERVTKLQSSPQLKV